MIPLARAPERLREVLTPAEVARLIEAAPGPKYRAALSLAYGAGGLGGALLAGALWERAGAGITFSAASLLALLGLILVWRGVPGDSANKAVR